MPSLVLFLALALVAVASVSALRMAPPRALKAVHLSPTQLSMGARNRAWAKGDLSDKDIFDDDGGDEKDKKGKFKLDPETVFFEGPPSSFEVLFPALSILTVIGIVPFVAAVSRQFWVKYKFTSRRISIQSGFGGKTTSEIIYPDVSEIRFVYRAFGSAGDMVLFLKDGAKAELRFVPEFESVYEYVLGKCDEECREKSMKLSPKKDQEAESATA
mmetsp:Transcript_29979/g.66332  ORF Transcript_29979/g.66332 Transcript_29979/m.66332 type:complete len:215 (-) Transcript_29979:3614-4258(-)